jgi:hypothetical protein
MTTTPTASSTTLTQGATAGAAAAGSTGVAAAVHPSIVRVSDHVSLAFGDVLRLGVEAAGQAPLSFQWTFNGRPMMGQTRQDLVIPDFSDDLVGKYACKVSNVHGVVTSKPVDVSRRHATEVL